MDGNNKINAFEEFKNEGQEAKIKSKGEELKVLSDKYKDFSDVVKQIDNLKDDVKELLRIVDRLCLKLDEMVPKKEFENLKKDFENKFTKLKFDTESKISGLLDAVRENTKSIKMLRESFENGPLKGKLPNLDKYKEELNKQMEAYLQEIERRVKKEMPSFDPNKYKEDVNKQMGTYLQELNQRFSDLENKILGLSKSVDERIERKLSVSQLPQKERERGEESAAKEQHQTDGLKPDEKSVKIRIVPKQGTQYVEEEGKSERDKFIKDLINYIQLLINSGNYGKARELYIELLSEYEKQEESRPDILLKIAEFHNKLEY